MIDNSLKKMAKQLASLDESSLLSLWDEYQLKVQSFEPTRQWEEAALIYCLIQSVRMKNQLFNYNVKQGAQPADNMLPGLQDLDKGALEGLSSLSSLSSLESLGSLEEEGVVRDNTGKRGKVLSFRRPEPDETV
mgnify:CR=1 FL=1